MEGISKPARINGGDGILARLYEVVERAEAVVNMAVGEQIETQQERLQQQAAQDERWSNLAWDFETWEDEEGNAAFGVPDDSPGAVRAGLLEYGTEQEPPASLVRMGVLSSVSDIGWSLTERFRSAGL